MEWLPDYHKKNGKVKCRNKCGISSMIRWRSRIIVGLDWVSQVEFNFDQVRQLINTRLLFSLCFFAYHR